MIPDDVRKLLGGYATGTLTDEERNLLFSAALEHQELFDALADEEALRELLAGEEAVITVDAIGAMLAQLDTVAPVTMVEVTLVDLASFDQLCTEMAVRQ